MKLLRRVVQVFPPSRILLALGTLRSLGGLGVLGCGLSDILSVAKDRRVGSLGRGRLDLENADSREGVGVLDQGVHAISGAEQHVDLSRRRGLYVLEAVLGGGCRDCGSQL